MDKNNIKFMCAASLQTKIDELKRISADVQNASNQETKSTAGDKHDTARAQAQLEVERLGNQLKNLEVMRLELTRIPTERCTKAQIGSYVKTTCGEFYLSIALGKLQLNDLVFFAVSTQSPIGIALKGKKSSEIFQLPNGAQCHIEEVW